MWRSCQESFGRVCHQEAELRDKQDPQDGEWGTLGAGTARAQSLGRAPSLLVTPRWRWGCPAALCPHWPGRPVTQVSQNGVTAQALGCPGASRAGRLLGTCQRCPCSRAWPLPLTPVEMQGWGAPGGGGADPALEICLKAWIPGTARWQGHGLCDISARGPPGTAPSSQVSLAGIPSLPDPSGACVQWGWQGALVAAPLPAGTL